MYSYSNLIFENKNEIDNSTVIDYFGSSFESSCIEGNLDCRGGHTVHKY